MRVSIFIVLLTTSSGSFAGTYSGEMKRNGQVIANLSKETLHQNGLNTITIKVFGASGKLKSGRVSTSENGRLKSVEMQDFESGFTAQIATDGKHYVLKRDGEIKAKIELDSDITSFDFIADIISKNYRTLNMGEIVSVKMLSPQRDKPMEMAIRSLGTLTKNSREYKAYEMKPHGFFTGLVSSLLSLKLLLLIDPASGDIMEIDGPLFGAPGTDPRGNSLPESGIISWWPK